MLGAGHGLTYSHVAVSDDPRSKKESEKPGEKKPPSEEILDELLDSLAEFFPGDMRERAREFVLDAAAAHPVTRLLAERVNNREARDRSGEEPTAAADESESSDKAGGEKP